MITLLILTLSFSFAFADPQTKQNAVSVTLEQDNIDDQITEIFNTCKCVIFYLCDEENFVIPHNQLSSTKVRTTNSLRNLSRIRCSNTFYYCCQNRNETSQVQSNKQNLRLIKTKNTRSLQLIEDFPWMVAVFRKKQNIRFKCGGSLIHFKVVLTHQQCVYASHPNDIGVVIGQEKLDSSVKLLTVSKIIKHELYTVQNINSYDIALLILANHVNIVKTIPIPNSHQTFAGRKCTTLGWTRNSPSGKRHLQEINTRVLDLQNCQRLLTNASLGWNYQLHDSILCVNGLDGFCKDEGGGPLVCEQNGAYIQVGIASGKLLCGQGGEPTMYTNVANLSDWIKSKLGLESIVLI